MWDFQKRLESIILLTCKKIQSQNPEDAFRIENVKTVIQVPFHDILYFWDLGYRPQGYPLY